MSPVIFAALAALIVCDGPPRGSVHWEDIAKLESIVRIPAGPGSAPIPLAQYQRYYTGIVVHGRRMISGEFVVFGGQKPGIFPVGREEDFPGIMDGGCGVVHLLYDIAAKRITEIGCNGVA